MSLRWTRSKELEATQVTFVDAKRVRWLLRWTTHSRRWELFDMRDPCSWMGHWRASGHARSRGDAVFMACAVMATWMRKNGRK